MSQGLSGEKQKSSSCCALSCPPKASRGVGSDLVSSVEVGGRVPSTGASHAIHARLMNALVGSGASA